MSQTDPDAFASACSELVGQIAVNPGLSGSIIQAIESGRLSKSSGPVGVGGVLRGYRAGHGLKDFLEAWRVSAPHLDAHDVSATLRSALYAYRLAQSRAHVVDAVWTGPALKGSELRRTEAVVNEIVSGCTKEILIVGYWLVVQSTQISELVDLLIAKARSGVRVRFVLDASQKPFGDDNFLALEGRWPSSLFEAPREVFTWRSRHDDSLDREKAYDQKLHAKVIVADRQDALVTSANLTAAGLRENLEMGLRARGIAAGEVARHFDLLVDEGVLVAL